MTGSGDERDDHEDGTTDLDEPRPPSTTTDPVQESVELSEARIESGNEPDGERDPLDVTRPPSSTTDPVQDAIEPARQERESGSERDASESDAESDAEGDGL